MRRTEITPFEAYTTLKNRFGPQGWWPTTRPGMAFPEYHPRAYRETTEQGRFEICAGAILTQNTSWKNVEKALANLNRARVLSPGVLCRTDAGTLEQLIRPAGYYRQKAGRLKDFAAYLLTRYTGNMKLFFSRSVLMVREELLSLTGVGPETADSMLLYAGNKTTFVVDAYTRRLGERLGWFGSRTYNELQEFFQAALPVSLEVYNEFHALIVAQAKYFCQTKPLCGACPLRHACSTR